MTTNRDLTAEEQSAVHELQDLATKIVNDGEVDDEEIAFISGWLERNHQYKERWPFSNLFRLLTSIMEDGVVDETERLQLMSVLAGLSAYSEK